MSQPGAEPVELTRDLDVVVVPEGTAMKLPAGTKVTIQQSLGGTHTVITDLGFMARVAGKDADAIGLDVVEEKAENSTDKASVEAAIWDALRTCYDPEIPVDIVELGLVYECNVNEVEEDGRYDIDIKMTLTAPGCGMGPVLQSDVETKVKQISGVEKAMVEVVFDPPWAYHMMSEAARLQLGMM